MRKIFIDGDGSPVKNDVIEIAASFQLEVMIVTSVDHYTNKEYPSYVQLFMSIKGQTVQIIKSSG